MPGKVQDVVNPNQKQENLNPVSELLSKMTTMQDYINLQMAINFSEDIKSQLKIIYKVFHRFEYFKIRKLCANV